MCEGAPATLTTTTTEEATAATSLLVELLLSEVMIGWGEGMRKQEETMEMSNEFRVVQGIYSTKGGFG